MAFPDLAAAAGYQEVSPKYAEPSPPQHQYPPSIPEAPKPVSDLSMYVSTAVLIKSQHG